MRRIKVDFNEVYHSDFIESLYQAQDPLVAKRGDRVIAFCCCTEMDATFVRLVRWTDGSTYYGLKLHNSPRPVSTKSFRETTYTVEDLAGFTTTDYRDGH